MAKRAQRIRIDIETRAKLAAVEKSQKEIRELTGKIEQSTRASARLSKEGGTLGGAFKLGGAIAGVNLLASAITRTAGRVVRFSGELVQLFGEQERVEIGVAAALRVTGQNVDALLPRYKALASEIQGLTEVGDEQTLGMIATATQMGVTGDKMEETMKGAIGLSKAFNLDLTMAARAASAAVQGQTSLLTRYIPMLQDVEGDAAKVAAVQRAMANGFEQAKEEAKGTAGQMGQMGNAAGDLKEELGEMVAPAVLEGMRKLLELARLLKDTLGGSADALRESALAPAVRAQEAIMSATTPEDLERAVSRARGQARLLRRARQSQEADILDSVKGKIYGSTAIGRENILSQDPEIQILRQQEKNLANAIRLAEQRGDELVASTAESAKLLEAEVQATAAAEKRAQAEEDAAIAKEFQRKLAEGMAALERQQAMKSQDAAERMNALKEEQRVLQEAITAAEEERDVDETLKLRKELLDIEAKISAESEVQKINAQEINALAKLQGLESVGDGRFVQGNLSRFEQSRAAVQGQSTQTFDPATGQFAPDGGIRGGLQDPEAHFQTIGEGALAAVYEYQAAVGTLADQVNVAFTNIFQGIEQGISTSITGLIDGTMTWGDALRNVGNTIVQSIIESFARMAAEWITQQIVMMTVGRALQAATTTATAAQALTLGALWSPAAVAASIATMGGALAFGPLAKAQIAASAVIPGFADGGLISGPGGPREDSILARLSSGEFVVNAAATMQHRPLLEAINNGQPTPRFADGGPVGSGGTGSNNAQRIVLVDSRRDADRLRRDPEFENLVIEIGRRERNAF